MRRSEYETQAYVNDGLNQQQGLDSQEGSAALLQANKPEVDGTDIQKARILAKAQDQHVLVQSSTPKNMIKPISRRKSPIQTTETSNTLGKVKTNKLFSPNDPHRTH